VRSRTVAGLDTLTHVPPIAGRIGRLCALVSFAIVLAACSGGPAASIDPGGPCTADVKMPGAYAELESDLPPSYRGAAPTRVDSGRNCSPEALGVLVDLGFDEVRFAGATWSFGGERALVMAVFTSPGLDASDMAAFYVESARVTPRVEILAESEPTIAGRPGFRLDTQRVDRLQTVVVWPAARPDVVNVVLSNDLPDARITEAIEAFGDR
jgi:hypothetical protein